MSPIGLDDMPEELLHEIVAYLLHPDQYPPMVQSKHFTISWPSVSLRKSPHGKDVMSLSSCCKWMRDALFGKWLMESLWVEMREEDLGIVESLTQEIRDCVR
jgi:hypothetical protein